MMTIILRNSIIKTKQKCSSHSTRVGRTQPILADGTAAGSPIAHTQGFFLLLCQEGRCKGVQCPSKRSKRRRTNKPMMRWLTRVQLIVLPGHIMMLIICINNTGHPCIGSKEKKRKKKKKKVKNEELGIGSMGINILCRTKLLPYRMMIQEGSQGKKQYKGKRENLSGLGETDE